MGLALTMFAFACGGSTPQHTTDMGHGDDMAHQSGDMAQQPGDMTQQSSDGGDPCAVAGGSCVAVVPGSCDNGHAGAAGLCGTGVGTMCCIPDATCKPLPTPGGSANPASAYCVNMGYQLTNENCVLPDGSMCEQFSFYNGGCGQTYSFCELHGGTVTTTTTATSVYATCTLSSGASCEEQAYATSCSCK
ncbi:MAG: DUF333 domain-containing protein [Polyangia bacterium]